MEASVYKINKGINKPIEFKGLKAQYIVYLAIGLVALFILCAVLFIMGVNMFICLGITVLLGVMLFMSIYGISNKYGQHGLLKKMARRSLPTFIKSRSRKQFLQLKVSHHGR